MSSRCRWLRLEALRLPASVAVVGGLSVVGAVAIGAAGVELLPGRSYRARLQLSGLAQLASRSRLESEFQKLGFVQVQAWDTPRQLPADWPSSERAEARSGKTWWLQGVYQGAGKTFDLAQLEDDGVIFLWVAEVAPAAPPAQSPPAPPPPQSWAAPLSSADAWALGVISRAFGQVHQRSPELQEALFIAALCRLESNYGRAYGAAKNWGSVHAGKPPCGPTSIPWTDSDAQGKPYSICMKAYSTDEDGAADVIWQITQRRPLVWQMIRQKRPIEEIAAQLRAGETVNGQRVYGYYEAPAATYAKALRNNLAAIVKATGLPDPFAAAGAAPASSSGGGGAAVVLGLLLLGGVAARGRR